MRVALIDGSNIFEAAKAINLRIDYKALRSFLNEDEQLLRAYYFTALRDKSIESPLRKTVDWLSHNGYICVTKKTQEYNVTRTWIDADGIEQTKSVPRIKGNVDVEIATYAFTLAKQVKEIWLFSGDGDFTCMVKALQEQYSLKVYVVSSIGLVSTELRQQADKFIELKDIEDIGTIYQRA